MSPALDDGDIAFVHPHAPVRNGNNVHIILKSDEAYAKRLVSWKAGIVTLRQFNPPLDFDIAADKVRFLRKIVGKWNG